VEDLFAEETRAVRLELGDVDVVEWVAGAVGCLRGGLEALPARGWPEEVAAVPELLGVGGAAGG